MIILHDGEGAAETGPLVEKLAGMFQMDASVRVRIWSFQQLERLDFRAMAARLAGQATVLAVATRRQEPLPEHIRRWIEQACGGLYRAKPVLISLAPWAQGCAAYLHSLSARWGTPCLSAPAWARPHGEKLATVPKAPPSPPEPHQARRHKEAWPPCRRHLAQPPMRQAC